MSESLFKKYLQETQYPFLIMSHRGQYGGNIVMNTIPAVELAVRMGSDMVEVDICRTKDGVYYLFHDLEELTRYGIKQSFSEMTSEYVDSHPLWNNVGAPSGFYAPRLEAFLDWLPEELLINIDRSWFYWEDPAFMALIEASGKKDQLLLKSPVKRDCLDALNQYEGIQYMPIMYQPEELAIVQEYDQHELVALELIVNDLDNTPFTTEWLQEQKKDYLILYNAEDIGEGKFLFDQFNDTYALLQGPEAAWGAMVRHGVDIIQTDWPYFLKEFRERL